MSVAAGLSVLGSLEEEGLVEAAQQRGEQLLRGLETLQQRFPPILKVRGTELLQGLVLGDPATGQSFETPGIAARVGAAAMERGLITYPGSGADDGKRGDHLLLGPPLSISAAEIDELLEQLAQAFEHTLG